jgi:hypothetical protein
MRTKVSSANTPANALAASGARIATTAKRIVGAITALCVSACCDRPSVSIVVSGLSQYISRNELILYAKKCFGGVILNAISRRRHLLCCTVDTTTNFAERVHVQSNHLAAWVVF